MIVQYSIIFVFLVCIYALGVKKAFFWFFVTTFVGIKFKIVGPLNVEDLLIIIFYVASINEITRMSKRIFSYPFLICSLLSVLSILHSAFFTTVAPHVPSAVTECLEAFSLPFLLFTHLRKRSDLIYLAHCIVYACVFIFVVTLAEWIVGDSIWLNWVRTFAGQEFGWEMQEIRFGTKRIQSVFMQSVTYGYFCVSMLVLFLFTFVRWKNALKLDMVLLASLSVTFVFGCIWAGSRSSIFPMAIVLFLFFAYGRIKMSYLVIMLVALIGVGFAFSGQIDSIITSITQSNKAAMGSSTDMRIGQFEIAYAAFSKSPLTGLGYRATFESVSVMSGILGAESVWLALMINEGILGILAYISIYVTILVYMRKQMFLAVTFVLIHLLVHTLTSTPGIDTGFVISLAIIMQNTYSLSNEKLSISQILRQRYCSKL